jgi:hypothetical protein
MEASPLLSLFYHLPSYLFHNILLLLSLPRICCSLPPLSLLSANLCSRRSRRCTIAASSHGLEPRRRHVAPPLCSATAQGGGGGIQPQFSQEAALGLVEWARARPWSCRTGPGSGLQTKAA